MNFAAQASPAAIDLRQRLYDDMSSFALTPLWGKLHDLVPQNPKSPCVAAHWQYEQIRPFIIRSGEVITAEEAVRRVLILENPALPGSSSITQSLYAGLQLIMPGEVAPSHRHTQSALRFIVEGSGAYTAVNGERTTMRPGDFIITPSMTWHDHGNETDVPVVWLDGLDIPLIRYLDAGFAENSTEKSQQATIKEGASFAKFGYNMTPIRSTASPFGATSPIFSYPYERSREALHKLELLEPLDAWDGVKLRYINPLTGGSPMPTMATFMQRLPAGFVGLPYRQTDGAIFSVVEGTGSVTIAHAGETTVFNFSPRDHFVIPSWHTAKLTSSAGCVLFSYSDRPVQQALSIHREERLSA
jgi:gentisate 1,2-dioxygenase